MEAQVPLPDEVARRSILGAGPMTSILALPKAPSLPKAPLVEPSKKHGSLVPIVVTQRSIHGAGLMTSTSAPAKLPPAPKIPTPRLKVSPPVKAPVAEPARRHGSLVPVECYTRGESHDLNSSSLAPGACYAKGAFGGVPSSSSCPWLCYEKNLYITLTYSSMAPDVAGRFEYIRAGFW